jgi:hypothetical protein
MLLSRHHGLDKDHTGDVCDRHSEDRVQLTVQRRMMGGCDIECTWTAPHGSRTHDITWHRRQGRFSCSWRIVTGHGVSLTACTAAGTPNQATRPDSRLTNRAHVQSHQLQVSLTPRKGILARLRVAEGGKENSMGI